MTSTYSDSCLDDTVSELYTTAVNLRVISLGTWITLAANDVFQSANYRVGN